MVRPVMTLVRTNLVVFALLVFSLVTVEVNAATIAVPGGQPTIAAAVTAAAAGDTISVAGTYTGNEAVNLNKDVILELAGNITIQSLVGNAGSSVNLQGNVLTIGAANTTVTVYPGIISGAGRIVKNNTNTQEFSGANTYAGGTTLDGGFIRVANNAGLGTGVVTINNTGKRVILTNGIAVANNFTVNGGNPDAGQGVLEVAAGGTATISGTINFTANSQNGGHLNGANGLILSGLITSSVNVVVRAGTVRISSASTFTQPLWIGGTVIAEPSAGTLAFANVEVGISAEGFFRVDSGTVTATAVRDAFRAGVVTANQTSHLQVYNGTLTVSNGISTDRLRVGFRNLTTVGTATGTLIASGGAVDIGAGTGDSVDIGRTEANSSSGVALADFRAATSTTFNVGTFRVGTRTGDPGQTNGTLRLSSTGVNTVTATTLQMGDSPGSGNTGPISQLELGRAVNTFNVDTFTIGNQKSRAEVFFVGAGGTLTLNGRAGAAANCALRIGLNGNTGTIAAGTMNLAGGTFNASLSTLIVAQHDAGAGGATGSLTFDAGTVTATTATLARPSANGTSATPANTVATIVQNGGTFRVGAMTKFNGNLTYTWNGGAITNAPGVDLVNTGAAINAANAVAHTISVEVGRSASFNAAAILSGVGSILKTGDGRLTLAAPSTYTGGTTISAGTLNATNATGSATGSGDVTVVANATLGGTGSVAGNAIVNGTVSAGVTGTNGTLTVGGSATFNAGSALSLDLNGVGTSDQLAVAGTVSLAGSPALNATSTGTSLNQSVTLVNNTGAGAITGTFNGVPQGSTFIVGNRPFLVSYVGGTGNDVVFTDDGPEFTAAATNTAQTIEEGTGLAAVAATVPGGRPLVYSLFSGTLPEGITLNADGTFSGTASANAAGAYAPVIRVTDNRNTFDQTTLNITVTDAGFNVADIAVNETAGTVTITVTRVGLGTGPASVQADTSNASALAGLDYTAALGVVLNWANAETGPKTFTVPILDDSISEGSETFVVTLSNPTGTILSDVTGIVTITDDETLPSLSVSDVSVGEAAGSVIVTVTLTGVSSATVSADLVVGPNTATAGVDFTASTTTLTWLPGETGIRTVQVPIVSDLFDEADETVSLALNNVSASAAIADGAGQIVIVDDDIPPLAANDALLAGQATPKVIAVLGNDSGLGNTPVTVTIIAPAANGTLVVNADNTVTYTGGANFTGSDSFTYRVTDSVGQFSDATVSLTVTPAAQYLSLPTINPNPVLAGVAVIGQAQADTGTILWNWGDGTASSGTSVSHTYANPGVYTVQVSAITTEGARTTVIIVVFVSLGYDGPGGNGSGGGATPPGVTGILVGGAGAGPLQGGSGKIICNYVRREKTTYMGSLGKLSIPVTITQASLMNLPSTLTIGSGASMSTFRFDLSTSGKGKATGLPSLEFSIKKKRFKFKAQREDLTALTEVLGGPQEFQFKAKQPPMTLLVPVSLQIGDKVFLAMTFQVTYKQISSGGKGGLAK